jgi:ribonuclease J
MVRLTFYGGINEIGGNKILLEDGDRRLFLDFGFPFKRYKLFYEEYMKPRSGSGLLDLLAMELLPPLEGPYRDDLVAPGLWQRFRDSPLYRRLTRIDGVLLSHAHLDHSGYISLLREDIPIYSTAVTAFIAKAMQDSGKSGFDQQVCYFSPTAQECPTGWKQIACLTDSKTKKQRQFCLADANPEDLSPEATRFWEQGFWQKTARQKELVPCPLTTHGDYSFSLHCFPVDHSIPGACAWGIETSSGWVIYSGDLRLHGKRARLTREFTEQAASLQPKALILEGTNIRDETSFSQKNVTEQEVYENGLRAIASSDRLVIADFSPRDVDRLLTFLQIAKDTGRKLAILPKDAYLLKTVRLLEPQIPDIARDDNTVIYQKTTASPYPDFWQRSIYEEYQDKIVLADEVSSAQEQFILCFSFFDLNELPSIRPQAGGLYVYSSSEPHDEEQEIDFRRLHEWIKHFGIKGFGLPVKKGGEWHIPDAEKGLHASGHACGSDLLRLAREIKPEFLIPVHCEHPDFYLSHLSSTNIKIILPSVGETIEL